GRHGGLRSVLVRCAARAVRTMPRRPRASQPTPSARMTIAFAHARRPGVPPRTRLRDVAGVFQYSRRALALVWTTSRALTIVLVVLAVVAGALPGAIAWVGRWLIDAVVAAAE